MAYYKEMLDRQGPSIILAVCPFGRSYLVLHLSWAPCDVLFQILFDNRTNIPRLERSNLIKHLKFPPPFFLPLHPSIEVRIFTKRSRKFNIITLVSILSVEYVIFHWSRFGWTSCTSSLVYGCVACQRIILNNKIIRIQVKLRYDKSLSFTLERL